MEKTIENLHFEEERALYGISDTEVRHCAFGGPIDGESALKETNEIAVIDCDFKMRYVLWHVNDFRLERVTMDTSTRAALWYCEDGVIVDSKLHGIKVLRECKDINVDRSDIVSDEFAWRCDDLKLNECTVSSVYPFFQCTDLELTGVKLQAKYACQYVNDARILDCRFETKDALWHSKDVTVEDSVIDGEYMAWYSENLTLIRCVIKGTQPFCYCKNLKLVDCELINADRAFEYSSVHAKIKGRVESIKNPLSGKIEADEVGEIIREGSVKRCHCDIVIGGKEQ